MNSVEDKYANRPNLLRVAKELAGYKNPVKILQAVELVLKSGIEDSTDGQKDIGLLGG